MSNAGGDKTYSAPIPGAVTMMQDEFYFLKEQAFTQSERFTFDAAEVKWFTIDPRNYTPGATQTVGSIILRLPAFSADAGPIFVDFYVNPTLGAAVQSALAMPSFNRAAASAITAQLELRTLDVAPTVSLGTPLSQLLVPSTATGSGQQTGNTVNESLPFAIDLTSVILMVVTNTDGAGTSVNIRNGWFEI